MPKLQILARVNGRAVIFESVEQRAAAVRAFSQWEIVPIKRQDLGAGDRPVTWEHYKRQPGITLVHLPRRVPATQQTSKVRGAVLLTTKEASVLTGYTRVALTRLARKGRILGAIRDANDWWWFPLGSLPIPKERGERANPHARRYHVVRSKVKNAGYFGVQ